MFKNKYKAMKEKLILSILLVFLIGLKSNAQDLHLSQFWNTPLIQNPSFAGKSGKDLRAIVNYRSQWGSVTSNPFQTFGANLDMRFSPSSKGHYLAGGISMYTDIAGASKMRTTLVNLALAYHLKINRNNYISAGLQGGINQRNIDESDLRWDSQFEGTGHNPSLPSNEKFSNMSELKPSFSAGISYLWSNKFERNSRGNSKEKILNIGFAVHHFNTPSFSFTEQDKLGLKYIGSIKGSFGVSSSKWYIQPAVFTAVQKKAMDVLFGSLFKYKFSDRSQMTSFNKSFSLAFGGYYRLKDALIPAIELQWAGFNLGLSYDVNLSDLTGASNARGGFEISLKFLTQSTIFGRKSKARYF